VARPTRRAPYSPVVTLAAVISFRLDGTDGVSIEARKWRWALGELGYASYSVAGEGPVDWLIPELAIGSQRPPGVDDVAEALSAADLVIVENLCSLPLNPPACSVVADVCAGRPTILHHHDLAWQRPGLGDAVPPDDPRWRHVTINELSRQQLSDRALTAVTIYNCFDTTAASGEGAKTRETLGVTEAERLVLQPTRAIPRKNVSAGIHLAASLDARFWLLGPAEDGFDDELDGMKQLGGDRIIHGPGRTGAAHRIQDAYAASDLIVLPSTWEGFGNPSIESAIFHRPLCIGPYPVAAELLRFGFEWFTLDEVERMAAWLDTPDPALLAHNYRVAETYFSLQLLPRRLAAVIADLGLPLP
jgi:mannosylglucosylglycerate synthase